MPDCRPRYHAFLLRCWKGRGPVSAAGAVWRFSLEDPQTGQRHGFASLAALVAFLQSEVVGGPDDGAPTRSEGRRT